MDGTPSGASPDPVTDYRLFFERECDLGKLDVKLRELETLTYFFRPYLLRHNGRSGICRYDRDRTVEGGNSVSCTYGGKPSEGLECPVRAPTDPPKRDLAHWHSNCYRRFTAMCYHLRWSGESPMNPSMVEVENFSAERSEVETFWSSHRLLSVENDRV